MCCQRYLIVHKTNVFNPIIQPGTFLDVFAKDMNGKTKLCLMRKQSYNCKMQNFHLFFFALNLIVERGFFDVLFFSLVLMEVGTWSQSSRIMFWCIASLLLDPNARKEALTCHNEFLTFSTTIVFSQTLRSWAVEYVKNSGWSGVILPNKYHAFPSL